AAWMEEVTGEPNPVAEQGSLRERAGWIDRDDAHRLILGPDVTDKGADQARLSDPRWPGDPDRVGVSRFRIQLADELIRERVGVLHERDRTGQGSPVAPANAVDQRLDGPLAAACPE